MPKKILQCIFNTHKKNERAIHDLKFLFWECTHRCNLNCLHCGSDCTSDNTVKDMPFDDFYKAILPIKEKYDPKNITVAIIGGEPLVRDDLAYCGNELQKLGFNWGIVTNGYNYTPDIHNSLIEAGMGTITLSLDGFKSSHNWLRSNEHSFDRASTALRLITTTPNLIYDIVTCVNKKNIHELNELKEYLIEEQVIAWRLFAISPIGRAAHNNELTLDSNQLRKLMDFIVNTRKEKRMKTNFGCDAYLGKYELEVRDSFSFCRAGINVASIFVDGSISACPRHC